MKRRREEYGRTDNREVCGNRAWNSERKQNDCVTSNIPFQREPSDTRTKLLSTFNPFPAGYASTTPTLCSVSRGDFIGVSNFLQIIANRRLTGGSKQKSDKRDATSVASALSKRCDFWETNLGLSGIRNERNEERKM
ncbi:hypothetical protein HN011_004314 [Eciton burchellii]|nr:hypothetical protein HN011_004314 [Eciton burchellii]